VDVKREFQRLFTKAHAGIYKLTKGKVGGKFGKSENVVLTTKGRKSGKPRTTPLVVTPDGDRLLLVASNGGNDRAPDWYLNLVANPDVTILRGTTETKMHARTASAEERPDLWQKVVANYKGYDGYQTKTSREIPVVVCEPVS
jgi:deazaflavin-dependent oxidoreductase (nitroreductase family)